MKKLSTYQTLCTDYYDLHKPILPKNEWQFYLEYAKNARGPILEPMCGTGHFLIPLMEEGFTIEGFDASESMLARLLERCKQRSLHPAVWFGFLEDLIIQNRYSLIFIPVGSFNLINNQEAVIISLKALYDALMPGGLLVLEIMMHPLAQQLPINQWITADYHRADAKKLTIKTIYKPMINGIVPVVRRYVLYNQHNEIEKMEVEEYALRFYTSEEICSLLNSAGFQSITPIKAFVHATAPGPNDPVIIYECKK